MSHSVPLAALLTLAVCVCGVFAACGGEGDASTDWLVSGCNERSALTQSGQNYTLSNGIVERTLSLDPSTGLMTTTSLFMLTGSGEKLRSPAPESAMVVNGVLAFVGGPTPPAGDTRPRFKFVSSSFRNETTAGGFHFVPGVRGSPTSKHWPPLGLHAEFVHALPCSAVNAGTGLLNATITLELFDGTAATGKRVSLAHSCSEPLFVTNLTISALATVHDSSVSFLLDAAVSARGISDVILAADGSQTHAVGHVHGGPGLSWFVAGDSYTSFTCVENAHDALAVPADDAPVRGMMRYGLEDSRAWRTIAPQMEQNPVTVHATCVGGVDGVPPDGTAGSENNWCYDDVGTKGLEDLIDSAAELGVELLAADQNMNNTWRGMIGSEFVTPANTSWFKALVQRAAAHGIDMGAYELLLNARSATALDQAAPSNAAILPLAGYDAMDPTTMMTCHNGGNPNCKGGSGCCSMCGATAYFQAMMKSKIRWMNETGASVVLQDGSGFSPCANTSHVGHHGMNDTYWRQYEAVRDLYHAYLARPNGKVGIITGMPGSFVDAGQAKVPGGYDEMTWSLDRWTWIHRLRHSITSGPHGRDTTVPNVMRLFPIALSAKYHPDQPSADHSKWEPVVGHLSNATLAPLEENLNATEWALFTGFGTGVYAQMRATYLWDGPNSKALMMKWITWAKKYRSVLGTDFVTLLNKTSCWTGSTQPSSSCTPGLDAIMHRAPAGLYPDAAERAMVLVWNGETIPQDFVLPLPMYYTGLAASAGVANVSIREEEGTPVTLPLGANDTVALNVNMPAFSFTWYVVTA